MPLTDTRVQTLTTGKRDERLVADINGLYLRLRKGKGGITRTWQFRRRDGSRLSVITLNTYPKMSLKEARLKAAELTARRDLACPTVTEAAEQWLAERVHTTHRRPAVVEGYVRRAVLPALGSHRLRDVLPADIGKMVRDYRDEVSKVRRRCSGATLFRFHALATIVVLFLGVGSAGVQTEESSAYKCVFDAAYNTLSGAAPVRSQGLESMYVGHRVDFAFSRLPTATVTTDINSATMEPMDFVVHQRGGKSDGWMKRKQPNVLNLHSIM